MATRRRGERAARLHSGFLVGLGGALLGLGSAACGGISAGGRLDVPVIVVALDSIPARLVGPRADGTSLTPVLDALATRGLVYERCLANSPWSDATLAAALRGAAGSAGGAATPLAAELAGAGWRTHAIVSHDTVATADVLAGFADVQRLGAGLEGGAPAADAVRAALALLDTVDPRPPFVLLHLADARPPHHRYPGLVAAADEPYDGPCTAALPHAELLRLAPRFEARDFARLEALVASEVAAVDAALGVLLDGLARRGLSEEVLLAVVGTRGAWLGEDGRVGLVPGLEPEVLHVPLVLHLPARIARARSGLAQHGVVESLVSTLDLAPSLRDALELASAGSGGDADALDLVAGSPRADESGPARGPRDLQWRGPEPDASGRSILPGAPAPARLLRMGTRRGMHAAAVYADGGGLVRDLERGNERILPLGRAAAAPGRSDPEPRGRGAAPVGSGESIAGELAQQLAGQLDAWLGPLPR